MDDTILTTAKHAALQLELLWDWRLDTILAFNLSSPEFSSFPRVGKQVFNPTTQRTLLEYFLPYLKRYQNEQKSQLVLGAVTTTPDPALEVILKSFANLEDTSIVSSHHRKAMAAENLLGGLLERYITARLEPYGWVWCCGNTVRAVDFLSADLSFALQIKNRDNSENSSSSSIRHGTDIQKWFRVFSKTGKTNWQRFPAQIEPELSEEEFYGFIRNYPKQENP